MAPANKITGVQIAKWAAKFCGEVQMQTAVAVLKAAVIADETSWATAQMLDLVRQLAPTSWEKLLDKQTAHLLIDHFMAERKWQLVLRIYQQQAANSQVSSTFVPRLTKLTHRNRVGGVVATLMTCC